MRLSPIVLIAYAILGVAVGAAYAAPVDSGFSEALWASSTANGIATRMAWAPDGSNRLFVTLQGGSVEIFALDPHVQGHTYSTFATIEPVFENAECGLLGLAFDANFSLNHYIYFFVTVSAHEQQIIRYTDQGGLGTNKTVIVVGLPTIGVRHNGGALAIGPDEKLYWGIGDNGEGRGVNADLASLAAKIGRANLDGSVPNDNPFFDGSGPNADFIWARGVRNPFSLTFQPTTGELWAAVVGEDYEQAFVVRRGDHAGYNLYENDQPAGYVAPRIKYLTNGADARELTASGAVRAQGVVTFATKVPHGFRQGELITISGVADGTFNGSVYVASTPDASTFTALQAGPDAASGQGTATTQELGGCILGGAFYDSSQFPAKYRGNYFFGDFNTGVIARAAISAGTSVDSVDMWSRASGSGLVDLEVGPDGALYALSNWSIDSSNNSGFIMQTRHVASSQALVVSNANLWMPTASERAISVSLALAPTAAVVVNAQRVAGDSHIDVGAGSTLTFTTQNWDVPQPLAIEALGGIATDLATASIELSSPGLTSEVVSVHIVNNARNAFVLLPGYLSLPEGTSGTLSVTLRDPPPDPVVVHVARSAGAANVTVPDGMTLTFTPENHATPQLVTIAAAEDGVSGDDRATIALTADGISSRDVIVDVVDDDPTAPVITSKPVLQVAEGFPYTYRVTATGVPSPTFTLISPPNGMTIDPASGIVAWDYGPDAVVQYTPVTVVASNGVAPDASQAFTVYVGGTGPPDCSIVAPLESHVVSGTTAAFSARAYSEGAATQIARVEFLVAGQVVYSDEGPQGLYHLHGAPKQWDTTVYDDGPLQIGFRAFTNYGESSEISITVIVANHTDGGVLVTDAGMDAGAATVANMDADTATVSPAAMIDAAPNPLDAQSLPTSLDASDAVDAAVDATSSGAGSGSDSKARPRRDAGAGDAAGPPIADAATVRRHSLLQQPGSGCGCRVDHTSVPYRGIMRLFLVALLLAVRRHRAARRRTTAATRIAC